MESGKSVRWWLLFWVAICVIVAILFGVIQKQRRGFDEQALNREHKQLPGATESQSRAPEEDASPMVSASHISQAPDTNVSQSHKPATVNLSDIINSRYPRTWQAVFTSWYGKPAPDFTVHDIGGKRHTLSDYRGKNVLIIFWTTWCSPCRDEIPHLIALRDIMSENELAILAISNEYPALVRKFAARNKINYTVLAADIMAMPEPFRNISGIPASFFVDAAGKIKLAASGTLPLGDTKAILLAE